MRLEKSNIKEKNWRRSGGLSCSTLISPNWKLPEGEKSPEGYNSTICAL
jgi:hypothetical protein